MTDKEAIDTKPTNIHGWFNRASALYRWAVINPQNSGLRRILKIQLEAALAHIRAENDIQNAVDNLLSERK